VSVILLPSAMTGILAGRVSDKISRKYTISLGCALFAVGTSIGQPARLARAARRLDADAVGSGSVAFCLHSVRGAQPGGASNRAVHRWKR